MAWPAAAIIGAGADVLGGLFGMSGQSSANRANERIAKENREFQERMSSTAYQRAAKDLDAAGLNRILALGSPASTPGGATAVMQNKKAPLARGVSQSAHTALALKKASAEISNIGANTENTEANTELTRTRQLIASHGEVIAGITGDIVRALKTATGWDKMNTQQRADLINKKVEQARGFVTDALEQMGNSGKQLDTAWNRTRDSISIYINDMLQPDVGNYDPNMRGETGYTEAEYARKKLEYQQLTGEAKARVGRWLERYRKFRN